MAVHLMFYGMAVVIFTSLIASAETVCQEFPVGDPYNGYNVLHCSNMTETQFIDNSKQFMNRDYNKLTLDNVNTSKLPSYEKWLSKIEQIFIIQNKEFISAKFFKNFKKLESLKVSVSNISPVFDGLHISSETSKLDLIFRNNNVTDITSLCQGDYSAYWNLDLNNNQII